MTIESITFQIDVDKSVVLDHVAAVLGCDRSTLINQAIDTYLAVQNQHYGLICTGLDDTNPDTGVTT